MAVVILFCPDCREQRELTVKMGEPVKHLPCEHFLRVWADNHPAYKKIWLAPNGTIVKEWLSPRASERKMKRLQERRLIEGQSDNQYGTATGHNIY